jgi:hypothetical protein
MKMISEGKYDQFRVWWGMVTKLTIAMALFSAGMFYIWNSLIVTLWTSDEMVMQGGAVILISLIPFRYLMHYQFVNSLAIFKEIRKVKWMLVWEIVLYFSLAWWLGNRYGLMGLLSANLLSLLGGALFLGMKWMAVYARISFTRLVLLSVRLVVPLSLSAVIVYYCSQQTESDGLVTGLILSMLWCFVFLLVAYLVIMDRWEKRKLSTWLCGLMGGE